MCVVRCVWRAGGQGSPQGLGAGESSLLQQHWRAAELIRHNWTHKKGIITRDQSLNFGNWWKWLWWPNTIGQMEIRGVKKVPFLKRVFGKPSGGCLRMRVPGSLSISERCSFICCVCMSPSSSSLHSQLVPRSIRVAVAKTRNQIYNQASCTILLLTTFLCSWPQEGEWIVD